MLHIAFSSGLSGTYNSCRLAAEELKEEYPDRTVTVIDFSVRFFGTGAVHRLCSPDEGRWKFHGGDCGLADKKQAESVSRVYG